MTIDEIKHWLAEVRERESKATEGPWGTSIRTDDPGRNISGVMPTKTSAQSVFSIETNKVAENAKFIAHSRTDIPRLLAIAEAAVKWEEFMYPPRNKNYYLPVHANIVGRAILQDKGPKDK